MKDVLLVESNPAGRSEEVMMAVRERTNLRKLAATVKGGRQP